MKKTKIFGALLAGALAFAISAFTFISCSSPSGGDDSNSGTQSGRSKIDGKIGEYGYPYEVGDIVYKDGSATPYSSGLELTDSQKAAAIAVIFYKGNDLNSDDENGNAVTNKERILGVGLEQRSSASLVNYYGWSSGNGERKIPSIECSVRGEKGNWVISGDKDGHDNLYQIAKELGSDNDIYEYCDYYYEAFAFARNYAKNEACVNLKNTSFESDWYLPSIAELYYLWKKVDIVNPASKLCGGKTFGDSEFIYSHDYWSSSQAPDDEKAYSFSFDVRENHTFDGEVEAQKKFSSPVCNICAIREFTEGASVPAVPRPDAKEGKLGRYSKPYEVNDIVFSDGSATPYTTGLSLTEDQKAAAISVIFYTGTQFNGYNAFGSLETGIRRIGIALKQSSNKLAWASSSKIQWNDDINNISCKVKGEVGSYTFENNLDGSKTSYNVWNMVFDSKLQTDYPAFYFAKNYSASDGDKEWFIPTIAELYEIYKLRNSLNAAIELCGGDKINLDEIYWASSEYETEAGSKALSLSFNNGVCSYSKKDIEKCVLIARDDWMFN